MYGRVLNTIINIVFITYLLLLISFYFLHEGMRENINNINYSTVDAVAISGQFSEELYNNLKEKILTYNGSKCNYELTIKYEKKMGVGVYDTYYVKDVINSESTVYPSGTTPAAINERSQKDPNNIITTQTNKFPMYKGDKITIFLEDKEQTLYGKLISAPFMGMMGSTKMFNITSLKSSIIGRDSSKLVNGYEVKMEINDANREYAVHLVTEMSENAEKIFAKNAKYEENGSDTYSMTSGGTTTIGMYHIFNNGYYYRSWEDDGDGTLGEHDIVFFYQTTN